MRALAALALLLPLYACAGSVDDQIDLVIQGGDKSENASLQLLLSPEDVTPRIIRAVRDSAIPLKKRLSLLTLLRRLQVRESDARIAAALRSLASDTDPGIRRETARIIGDVGHVGQLTELIELLDSESDGAVLQQIISSIGILGNWSVGRDRGGYWVSGGEDLTADQILELEQLLRSVYTHADTDSLRSEAEEFLEKLACQRCQQAEALALRGEIGAAEQEFARALELVPTSRNVHHRFAKFAIHNLSLDQGKREYAENDLYLKIPRVSRDPVVDGQLDDAAWNGASRVNTFYRTMRVMRSIPDSGRAEALMVYSDSALYVGFGRYDEEVEEPAKTDDLTGPVDLGGRPHGHHDQAGHRPGGSLFNYDQPVGRGGRRTLERPSFGGGTELERC
jgi:hypothetical protein